jgi:hypothetical protein|tara:strand:+ start:273 stop:614 length:342 start_codon:yes stop_codon:yes gene_type:complete
MTKFSSPFMAKSPLKSEGGKWGQRDPVTNYSQREKLEDPKGHSKSVKKGLRNLPTMLLAGAASTVGAMPTILASTAAAAGAAGIGYVAEKITDFYSGAKNKNMKKAKEALNKK